MKILGFMTLFLAAVSITAAPAEYLANGGFESGSLTGWSLNAGGNHHAVTAEFGILPRSGSYLDTTNYLYNTNTLSQTIVGGPKQGILTGYIYLTDLSYFPAFMVSDGTDTAYAFIGHTSQYLGTEVVCVGQNGFVMGGIGPTVTTNTWHEMKYVVDDSGLDFYWDGALVMENWASITCIASIHIGGGWNTVPTGYDDFSFVDPSVPDPTCEEVLAQGYGSPADLNSDCYVNLLDIALLAQNWLRCIDPTDVDCEFPWQGLETLNETAVANTDAAMMMQAAESGDIVEGFEIGTYAQWTTVNNDLSHNTFMGVVMSSGGGISPHHGNFMAAVPNTSTVPMYAEKVLDEAGQGTLTAYINIPSWYSNYRTGLEFKASDGVSSALITVNTFGVQFQRDGGALTSAGISCSLNAWHEIKFVVNDGGVSGYWNGTPLFTNHNSPTKNVKKIIIGSQNANTLASYFDDVSFPVPQLQAIPPQADAFPPILQVRNKPFFPLGYYDHFVDTTAAAYDVRYAAYAAQSINTVVHWGSNWGSAIEYSLLAADRARANGLKYMPQIHFYALRGDAGYPLTLIDAQVDVLWAHPAMLGWYVADEPDGSFSGIYPPRLQEVYQRIEAHDLNKRPQFVVFYTPLVEAYLRAEPPLTHDIMMNDSYPCRVGIPEFGGSLWRVAAWTREQVLQCKIAGSKKAQVNVPQACGVNGWSDFRLPTFKEQRYLSYAPIVEGARGLLWWDYGDTGDPSYVQGRAEYRANITGPIATEISSLIPAIVSNATSISITSTHDTDTTGHGIEDVTYLFGKDAEAGYAYIIAVNHTPNTLASAAFTLTGTDLGPAAGSDVAIDVLFENRTVFLQPVGGFTWTLTDSFSPFDVNVYRLSPAAPPEDCAQALASGYNLPGDLSADCYVTLPDFGLMSQQWLECVAPGDPDCDKPWQ